MSGKRERGSALRDIIQNTISVSKELEALQREHQAVFPTKTDTEKETEFEAMLREEKMQAVNHAMNTLKKGQDEAKLMTMVANYILSLEADKLKLKAQVKRLCSENNWLRKSLTESQQLLQEAEITLVKTTADKEHLEFVHSQCKGQKIQMDLNSFMVIDTQEEEKTDIKDVPMGFNRDTSMSIHQDMNSLETSFEYEIPEKIRTLHQLTLQYINQGKPEVAIPLCRKAIQELERKTGRNNPDLASLLNILAVIYREQGRFEESIRILLETLEIRETVFGLKHPVVASTLNNLSVLHGKCGNFKTAEPFCQRALEIRQELLGPDHPDVAKQFCNLAILCSHLGRYDEVEHYYQRAVEIFEMELGPDDPNVAKTMNNLANCYLKQGKYKAAERMFKKVLKTTQIEEKSGEKQNHHHHGREGGGGDEDSGLDRGASPQRGAPGHWHKLSPLQSPTLNDTLRCLTDSYRGQGRLEDAAELEKLTIEKKLSDRTHRDRILQKFGDGSNSSSAENVEAKISSISSKKQGLQRKDGSKSSLNWGWVFGSRTT